MAKAGSTVTLNKQEYAKTAMFRCLKVWVKIGLGICNFAEWTHVHEIYGLPSKKFKEYQESGFLELAFLDRFTGNIDIDIYIDMYIEG